MTPREHSLSVFPSAPPDLFGPLVVGRAYRLRNGTAVYCFETHPFNADIALTWGGSDGWKGSAHCYHHERLTGRNHSYMGYGDNAQRLDFSAYDVIDEEVIMDDLRAAWEVHELKETERRRRVEAGHA